MSKGEAIYLLNDYIKADSGLKTLFAPKKVNTFPVIADEPLKNEKSYPYIRYRVIPGQGSNFRINMDMVQYIVGDPSFAKAGKILQRLREILNMDNSPSAGLLPLKDDKFKIQSVMFVSGLAPTGPDQENGVMERGATFSVTYVTRS